MAVSLCGILLSSLHLLYDAECCLSLTCFTLISASFFRQRLQADLLRKHFLPPTLTAALLQGFKLIPSLGQAGLTGMSQHQYHCPANPMPAAPVPLPLGQPQSGYSIPCGSGILPSESASQPIRSSALPAGSATPYTSTTGYIILLFSLMNYCLFLSTSP